MSDGNKLPPDIQAIVDQANDSIDIDQEMRKEDHERHPDTFATLIRDALIVGGIIPKKKKETEG